MEKNIQIVVEHHADGFVAYPLGMNGIVVGEGDTAEEALLDVRSAIRFHIETFGDESFLDGDELIDVSVSEELVEIG